MVAGASFHCKGENLPVAIVFQGAERYVGVDVETAYVGRRGLKGAMFRG